MSISRYKRNCSKNTSGLDFRLYAAPYGAITSASFLDEQLTGITLTGTTKFSVLEADWDGVFLNSDGETGRISQHEASLTARFSHASADFAKTLRELQNVINCGLVLIYRNGAGKWFISGIDPVERAGGSRPFMRLTHNYASGENIADEEGNRWELVFTKQSGEAEFYELDETQSGLMTNGTATFVDW